VSYRNWAFYNWNHRWEWSILNSNPKNDLGISRANWHCSGSTKQVLTKQVALAGSTNDDHLVKTAWKAKDRREAISTWTRTCCPSLGVARFSPMVPHFSSVSLLLYRKNNWLDNKGKRTSRNSLVPAASTNQWPFQRNAWKWPHTFAAIKWVISIPSTLPEAQHSCLSLTIFTSYFLVI
jgi:hypothetical protein